MGLWRKLLKSRVRCKSRLRKVINGAKYVYTCIFFSNLVLSMSLGSQLDMRMKHFYYQLLSRIAKKLILSLFSLIPFLYWERCWMNSSGYPKSSKFEEPWDSISNGKKKNFQEYILWHVQRAIRGIFCFFDDGPPKTFLNSYHIINWFPLHAVVNKYGRWREHSGLVENIVHL